MKTGAGLLCLALLAPPLSAESGPVETRYGTVTVDSNDDRLNHSISVNGSVVFKFEGHAVSLEAHLSRRGNDFVLAELQSGGIACPYEYVIIQLSQEHAPVVSERFGSCGGWDTADTRGDGVVVRIPSYAAHPDLLSPKELRRVERTTQVFTWAKGKLQKSEIVRK